MKLHHLALGAVDVEQLARFYRETLGLAEERRWHTDDGVLRSIWLDLGGARLMIERTAERRPAVEGVGAGLFLLALRVEPAEREALERRIVEDGGQIEERTVHSSYTRDPEGNRVAISTYPDAADGPIAG